jgi:tape measure domain-containing protein
MAEDISLQLRIDTSDLKNAAAIVQNATTNIERLGNAEEALAGKSQRAGQAQRNLGNDLTETGRKAAQARREMEATANSTGQFGGRVSEIGQKLRVAQGELSMMTGALRGSQGLAGGLETAGASLARFGGALGPIGLAVAATTAAVGALGYAWFELSKSLGAYQDRQQQLEGRLTNSLGSIGQTRAAIEALRETTQKTGLGFDAAADAFARIARNNESIGLSNKEMLQMVDTVQKLGVVSGASTGEMQAGMIQFGQALASGRLQGDELRSIMENFPALAKAIASNFQNADGSIGTTIGTLRRMGSEGELTADKIAAAILRATEETQREYEKIPDTMERANQRLTDNYAKMLGNLGSIFASSEFVQGVYTFLNNVAKSLDTMFARLAKQRSQDRMEEAQSDVRTGTVVDQGRRFLTAGALLVSGSPLGALNALQNPERFRRRATGEEIKDRGDTATILYNRMQELGGQTPEDEALQRNIAGVLQGQTVGQNYPGKDAQVKRLRGDLSIIDKGISDADAAIAAGGNSRFSVQNLQDERARLVAARQNVLDKIKGAEAKLAGGGGSDGIASALKSANEQIAEMTLRTQQVRQGMTLIGADRSKVMEADAANEAALTRLQKFGEKSTSGIEKWFTAYRTGLLDSKKAAQEASEANRVYEASVSANLNRRLLAAGSDPRSQDRARFDFETEQAARGFAGGEGSRRYAEFYLESLDARRTGEANQDRTSNEAISRQIRFGAEQAKLSRLSSDEYRVQIALLQKRFDLEGQGRDKTEDYYQTQLRLTEQLERQTAKLERQTARDRGIMNTLEQGARSLEGTFKNTFETIFTDGVRKGADIFGRGFGEIIKKISADMIYLIAVKPFEELAIQMASKLGQWIISMLPGGSPGASMMGPSPNAFGNAFGAGGRIHAFANGGAFTNRIVSSPTLFAFANGGALGLMGEAGEEAVMPLRRGSDGRLGVSADGGGAVSVVINDMRSSPGAERPETKEGRGPDGRRVISVMIRDEMRRQIRSGDLDREMAGSYGTSRTLARK